MQRDSVEDQKPTPLIAHTDGTSIAHRMKIRCTGQTFGFNYFSAPQCIASDACIEATL